MVWSRESPSGDETEYTYSPVGRLVYESRNGDISYTRLYSYHLDGSRWWVWRVVGRWGEHFDWYSYDPVSGRLTQVYDQISGVVNRFEWNPEGTLARWSDESVPYDRVYSYDEEGRLVRIGWDYRDGRERSRYEYRYNSDGFKVWEREWFETEMGWRALAYRFVCGIGCGRLPLAIYWDYDGADDWAIWSRYEWVTELLHGFWYEGYEFESPFTWRNLDYELLAGYLWVADLWLDYPGGGFRMRYWDRYGVEVGERLHPEKTKRRSFGRRGNWELPYAYVPNIPPVGGVYDLGNGLPGGGFTPPTNLENIDTLPDEVLREITNNYVCHRGGRLGRLVGRGLGRAGWCRVCEAECANRCRTLHCILACDVRFQRCLATGNF